MSILKYTLFAAAIFMGSAAPVLAGIGGTSV